MLEIGESPLKGGARTHREENSHLLRDYEILYIVRPELDDDQLQSAVGSVNKLIENLGGMSLKTDVWGRRRLAYEVKRIREGQYVLTDFQIEPARVPEMEATLKISDTVFRHLIVRKPEEKRARARRAERSTEAAAAESAPVAAPVVPAAPGLDPEAAEPQAAGEPQPVGTGAVEGGSAEQEDGP